MDTKYSDYIYFMEEITRRLNLLLANLQVQRANLQAVHWNLTNVSSFITFHNYFQKLYEYNTEHIDMVAEFIRIQRGVPFITLTKYVRAATIAECTQEESSNLYTALEKAFLDNTKIIPQIQQIFDLTDRQGIDIGDYMATMMADYGKRQWFLRSSGVTKEIKEEEGPSEGEGAPKQEEEVTV